MHNLSNQYGQPSNPLHFHSYHYCLSLFVYPVEEVPYYNIPPECPEATDVEGDCDVDQCTSESACEGDMCCNEGDLCCLNSCNQLSCATSRQPTYICSAIEQRLQGINTSYTPQCDSSGNFQPTQCMGDGDERRCWCVNTFNGIPLTNMSPDTNLNCRRKFVIHSLPPNSISLVGFLQAVAMMGQSITLEKHTQLQMAAIHGI